MTGTITPSFNQKVLVVGAGLAGTEAALYLAKRKVSVVLVESKTKNPNPAQKLKTFAELVCTNSLKSTDPYTPHGVLKKEMAYLDSFVLQAAKESSVPAGSALAVDRVKFSRMITDEIQKNPYIKVIESDVADPLEMQKACECSYTILATGPLTTNGLTEWIRKNLSDDDFYFYDAIAPIVDAGSLDHSKLYFKDRYQENNSEKSSADYLNIPLNEEEYYAFVEALIGADKVPQQQFEDYKFFESCLPIDVMAMRGRDTLRFSCMRPVGLEDKEGKCPFAVVQLRKENLLGDAFNIVGFQNRLTYGEQKRVFRLLPGLAEAEFLSLGSVHRNSFVNARSLLNKDLSIKKFPDMYMAGQIVGVEGYTESASMGLYVAHEIYQKMTGKEFRSWPLEMAMGALINYIMTSPKPVPSNINFGLFPAVPLQGKKLKGFQKKKLKKMLVAERALMKAKEFFQKDEI